MPATLNLDSLVSNLRGSSTVATWFTNAAALFKSAFQPATTPFGDTAELNASPGPNTVLVVGDNGMIPMETIGGQGVNGDLEWKFNFEGTGTRLSTLKDFRIHVEGNKRYGEVTQVMIPLAGGPGGGGDDGDDTVVP